MISVTKVFTFEAAHAISNHVGKCKNIHGHSYKLHVTVSSKTLNQHGMVIDFKDLKQIVNQYIIDVVDHSCLLKEDSNYLIDTNLTNIIWLKQEPTAEYLLLYFSEILIKHLPEPIYLKKLLLFETETCYAEWNRTADK